MANIEQTAPWRAWKSHAKIRQAFGVLRSFLLRPRHPAPPTLKHLNNHLARDIGLTPADLEELRHRWPSQTTHHPRG